MGGTGLLGIGKRWQAKISSSPDFEVVANDNQFRLGLYQSAIAESIYHTYEQLLRTLIVRYEGRELSEVIPGHEIKNEEGVCYAIDHSSPCPAEMIKTSSVSRILSSRLDLIPGIGGRTASILQAKGVTRISDLRYIRRYAPEAERFSHILSGTPDEKYLAVKDRKGPSHPLSMIATKEIDPARYRFIDIETMGIFGRPVILFGIASIIGNRLNTRQFLLRDLGEESAALQALRCLIPDNSVLVSFNGKSFDLPYLQDRFSYYGFECLPDMLHIDLLHPSRREWKGEYHDCRLSTLENRYLNISRDTDIPGMLVPEWYARYMENGNPGPLVPIVTHNLQDVESLALLFDLLRRRASEYYCVS